MKLTETMFAGPGKARHAWDQDAKRLVCGADQRKDRGGHVPMLNSHARYRAADVTCKRCLRAISRSTCDNRRL